MKFKKYATGLMLIGFALSSLAKQGLAIAAINGDQIHSSSLITESTYRFKWEDERVKFYQDLESKPWKEVSKKHIALFEQEEVQLINECCTLFNITPLDFQECKSRLRGPYDDFITKNIEISKIEYGADPVPDDLKKIITKELEDYRLNNKNFIILNNDSLLSPARVTGDMLVVNRLFLAGHVSEEDRELDFFRAIIHHEIMHILHDDTYTSFLLYILKHTHGKSNENQFQEFTLKCKNFHERRADILAGLSDLTVCKDLGDCFNMMDSWLERRSRELIIFLAWLNVNKSVNDFAMEVKVHDSWGARSAYLNQLHNEMTQAALNS
ncbi:MAG: hypothetical protein P4L31_00080 [Candidatus Babeliales bacterium]|nr:hypothetical protein [Candidatus Babeliales bacterium]